MHDGASGDNIGLTLILGPIYPAYLTRKITEQRQPLAKSVVNLNHISPLL